MIEVNGSKLEINLNDLFAKLSTEEKASFIRRFSIQGDVMEMVVAYLCGEDEEGLWTSAEPDLRQKMLERVEAAHIKDLVQSGPRYGWHVWSDIQHKLKTIHNSKEVYWALSHDERLSDLAHDFFKRHNIASNYTTDAADEDLKKVAALITDGFKALSEGR